MLKELYHAIRNDAEPKGITLDGRLYTTSKVCPVLLHTPATIQVKTLTALVDYLKANVDNLPIDTLICHVESPEQVSLYSALQGEFEQRKIYMQANLEQLQLRFNSYLHGEEFNILLQSCFVDYDADPTKATDRGLVLKYSANVKTLVEGTTLDDGTTQVVTAKAGIASVENVVLPNPVTLRPYRTFTEVEQPASKFVFRAKEGPQFMLVEADGGAWKSRAMKNIKYFMEFEVHGLSVIA